MLFLKEKRMHNMVTFLQGSTGQSADDLSSLKRKLNSFERISNLFSFFIYWQPMWIFCSQVTLALAAVDSVEKCGDGQQVQEEEEREADDVAEDKDLEEALKLRLVEKKPPVQFGLSGKKFRPQRTQTHWLRFSATKVDLGHWRFVLWNHFAVKELDMDVNVARKIQFSSSYVSVCTSCAQGCSLGRKLFEHE